MRPYIAFLLALLLSSVVPPLWADEDRSPELERGDYFFKTGDYLKASKAYRVAVLEKPQSVTRLVSLAHAVFALGNFHYASHTMRRAVDQLALNSAFEPDIVSKFPSRISYVRKLDELKRYVTYNRRDPSALTVLAYTYYADGKDEKALQICGYLKLLDREDRFVKFIGAQVERRRRAGKASAPSLREPVPEARLIVPPGTEVPATTPKTGSVEKRSTVTTPSDARPRANATKRPDTSFLPDTARIDEMSHSSAPKPLEAVSE